MSHQPDPERRTNFSDAPHRRPPAGPRLAGRLRPPGAGRRLRPRTLALIAGGALVVVVVAAAVLVKVVISGSSTDQVGTPSAPVTTVAAAGGTGTTQLHLPPGTALSSPEQDAGSREAFLATMKRMGLTSAQATCVADRVQATIGWSQLGESLMDPGHPDELERLMVDCVKG